MMMSEKADNDLTEYERVRLENIKRNADFLASIGLAPPTTTSKGLQPDKGVTDSKRPAKADKKRERPSPAVKEQPTRRSKRLSNDGIEDSPHKEESPIKEPEIKEFSYADIPFDSNELDDLEFEVYVILRKWRLSTSRALDIEPYKVFQNRTLCEMIRRRRNDPKWATDSEPGADLLECWGIGPSKVKADGFGPQALVVLAEKEAEEKLVTSRQSGTKLDGV